MALPDSFKSAQGTAVIWGVAAGSGVTKNLGVNNLASGSGQMGVYADLGALWDQEYFVHLWVETGTAPVAGAVAELWMACSYDSTSWPGKVDGTDAAYPTVVVDNKQQLKLTAFLIASADANTILKQAPEIWRPAARYVAPVLVNLLGQNIRNQGTPSANGTRVILIPRLATVED